MKISILQTSPIWEKKEMNLKKTGELVKPHFNNTGIVILPEMFTTGFSMNPRLLGEPAGGETFVWMKKLAAEGDFGICGSYIVEEMGRFYNRWIFMTPGGEYWMYDKRHLFSFAEEHKFFDAGKNRLVFSFRGIRILANICYDLRFPVWSRNRNDYDLIINSANWPEARRDVWLTLLKARAIENQCFVAGANITGTDGNGIAYCGDSIIIGPKGDIISSASSEKDVSVSADISLTDLEAFRKKFPVLKDADNFTIEI
jgi:omega-amidase